MDEIHKIAEYHPEIIYFPHPVKTWIGFITAECPLNPNIKEYIKIELVVPNYPDVTDIGISFGPQIATLNNTKFKDKLKIIIKNATSVFMILQQIKTTCNAMFPFNQGIAPGKTFMKQEMIEELKEVLSRPQEVTLFSTNDLKEITLTVKQISMTVKWKNGWEIVSSDLPEPLSFDIKKRQMPLRNIITLFLQNTQQMSEVWEQLEEIDLHCHVIDPKVPKPYNLYRRIYLSDSLSIFITLDPLNATICPDIKFLGSETVVQKFKNKHSEKLNDWDANMTVYDNLLSFLEITKFPQPPTVEKTCYNACFNDNECCICFSLESESETQPDKICPNNKCGRVFHSFCLLKWLLCDGMNKVIFGDIYGKCPHCEESISCSTNT